MSDRRFMIGFRATYKIILKDGTAYYANEHIGRDKPENEKYFIGQLEEAGPDDWLSLSYDICNGEDKNGNPVFETGFVIVKVSEVSRVVRISLYEIHDDPGKLEPNFSFHKHK